MAAAVPAAAATYTAEAQSAVSLYEVVDLGPHAGYRFSPDGTQIAGIKYLSNGGYVPSVRRSDGQWFDIPLPAGETHGMLFGINRNGEVVGDSVRFDLSDFPWGRFQAVRGTSALSVLNEVPPNAWARSINDAGVIVGVRYDFECRDYTGLPHCYIYDFYPQEAFVRTSDGSVVYPFGRRAHDPLGNPLYSGAEDVNGAGLVVGRGFDSAGSPRGFRYDLSSPSPLTLLETADAYLREARAVNERGDIVGSGLSKTSTTGYAHAFVYSAEGEIRDLGVAATGAYESTGQAINEAGDVVGGMAFTSPYRQRALLVKNGQVLDLNELVPPLSVPLVYAYDVDEQGRILVNAWDGASPSSTFYLLTPRPPAQGASALIEAILALRTAGVLNGGNANALIKKVENAIGSIEGGQVTAAINELEAFVNQVEAFVRTGKLTPATGGLLLAAARWLIDELAS